MTNQTGPAKKINVEYVAQLARLLLNGKEKALFQGQLEKIVGYVNDIARVDVTDVQPVSHLTASQNMFRRDESRIGLDRETVLKNAPVQDGRQFLVPKIV